MDPASFPVLTVCLVFAGLVATTIFSGVLIARRGEGKESVSTEAYE